MFVNRPVILFDGVCNLCNSSVQWVIERDKEARFAFATLQSDAARRELAKVLSKNEIDALPDSIVLLDSDGVHVRSAAALRIARGLGPRFALLRLGIVLPRPIRDAVYNLIARNRYRWFGRRDTCMTPTAELAARFLDAHEPRLPTDGESSQGEGAA
jgi:predicted DCC family thiol-disulfide oxidoreductase YuxK